MAFMKAMFPPAVTTTRRPAPPMPFSRSSLVASAARSSAVPSTGPYLWASGRAAKRASASNDSGGGP
jgi:hypothetical protein